jgi:membrane protease YdiL (CAAX protease family)
VWTFPSWLAAWLVEATGIDSVSLEATSRLILEGPTIDRLAMGFAVVVTAPLFEEVIFRGYLWEVSERAIGRWGAFLATTLLFAGYHLDPVHTVSLLPTAAFLGLLRLVSGSLWPGVLAHLANNGIAIVVTLWGTELVSEDEIPLWLAITGTSLTAVVFGMGYAWTRKRPHSGATP